MKFLIVPTQNFSGGVTRKEVVTFDDLPWLVKLYIKFFKQKVFVIHDEISFIKTNQPMKEEKKSNRCRVIKLLEQYTEARCGLTGTLLTKSPVNILDPYHFLSASFFPGEDGFDIADTYSITMALRTARGRRVMISQKEWFAARNRMIRAYKAGGNGVLGDIRKKVMRDLGISYDDCDHILAHHTYSPFINIDKLMKRVSTVTMTVTRDDIFDIKFDRFVYQPIDRPVKIDPTGLALGKKLIKLGFTNKLVLGKAPALELMHRLKDLCNGFEPIKDEEGEAELVDEEYAGAGKVRFEPLPTNPKLDALRELLDEIGTDKEQVIVWCSRRNALESVEAMLTEQAVPFVVFSGSQTDAAKAAAQEKAASGEARVFLANPASAGFGLNCLAKFSYMVWYCVDGSVERYEQAMHRILRGQSTAPKFAYKIYVRGSVEERNFVTLEAGKELLSASNRKEVFEFKG